MNDDKREQAAGPLFSCRAQSWFPVILVGEARAEMPNKSEGANVFTVNSDYATGMLRSLQKELTHEVVVEISIAELLCWVFATGAEKCKELAKAYDAKDEERIRRARQSVTNIIKEYQDKIRELFHGIDVDGNVKEDFLYKSHMFCSSSAHIALSGSVNDIKNVRERCKEGLTYANAFAERYRSEDRKRTARALQEDLKTATESFEKLDGTAHSGGVVDGTYSERHIRELISLAWSLDYVNMMTRRLRRVMAKEGPNVAHKARRASKQMKQLMGLMDQYAEKFDREEKDASKGSVDAGES